MERRLKEFYKCQCLVPQQVGSLGARDQVLSKRLKASEVKKEAMFERKRKHENENRAANTIIVYDSEEEYFVKEDDRDFTPNKKVKNIETQKSTIIEDTSPIAIRHGISTRGHLALLAGTLQSLGKDISSMPVSVSTVHRKRKMACRTVAENICQEFNSSWSGWPKIIQWDGKKMEVMQEDSGGNKEDVNVVVLSVPGSSEKLKDNCHPFSKRRYRGIACPNNN